MRSDFFQEIAESRERFYEMTLGTVEKGVKKPKDALVAPTIASADEAMDKLGNERRSKLLDFLLGFRFWLWI